MEKVCPCADGSGLQIRRLFRFNLTGELAISVLRECFLKIVAMRQRAGKTMKYKRGASLGRTVRF